MTDQADTGPIREVEPTWTDGDLVLVAWIEDGGLSQWIGRIVDERMGEGGPKPHRIAGAAIRVLERGAEIGALREQRDAMIWAAEQLQAERDTLAAELAAARDQIAAAEKRHVAIRRSLSFARAWPDGVTGKRMVDADDILAILTADERTDLSQSGQPTKGEPA